MERTSNPNRLTQSRYSASETPRLALAFQELGSAATAGFFRLGDRRRITWAGPKTDLRKVTEYMANSAHRGKLFTHGHFGFRGHDNPVAFRKVRIKTLK